MKVKTPELGGICQSLQGMDKGRYYLIVKINPDGTVMLADGNFKRLAAPKKKNLKHVKLMPGTADIIAEKISEGRQIFDTEVYSALKTYNYPPKDNASEDAG